MTNELQVTFEVNRRNQVPQIGARKAVRVNGKLETMYVQHVSVRAVKDYDAAGRVEMFYKGTATMTDHEGLFN